MATLAPRRSRGAPFAAHRSDAFALLLVIAVGAVVRLVFFPRAPVFIGGDTSQYYGPALALMTGGEEGFPLPLKRPPLYPAFVDLVGAWLGPDLRVLLAVQHLLGLATAALTYGIGRLAFGRPAGLLAGLATALSGGLLIFEHYVLTEALFTPLLVLAAFLALLGVRRDSVRLYVLAGLAIGLATLTRPHAQLLLPLVPLVALAVHHRRRPVLRAAVVTCVAAAFLIVPWIARNALVHDSFGVVGAVGQNLIFKTANLHAGRFVFYDPATPPDTPRLQAARLIQRRTDEKVRNPSVNVSNRELHAQLMRELDLSEDEADDLMRDVALDAIRARPLAYAQAVAEDFWEVATGEPDRLIYHWRLRDRVGGPRELRLAERIGPITSWQEGEQATTERLVNLYQSARLGPVVPILASIGLVAATIVPAWRGALLPGLAAVVLHLAGAAVVGFVARFHHPPDPLVHVVAAGGLLAIARGVTYLMARRRGPYPFRQPSCSTPSP
jgi:4-amino-4-deoxy-L-arabinose transferase-like glycosyltransferase